MSVRLCNNENVQTYELTQKDGAFALGNLFSEAAELLYSVRMAGVTVKASGPAFNDDGTWTLILFVSP